MSNKINLDNLRKLKDDWDGEGAPPISEAALQTAETILNTAGQAVPLQNGGVQIEWHCGGADFEVTITPEGTLELE